MARSEVIERSYRFYIGKVAPMIHDKFPEYEDRIAVGIAGEGSDCFGYDDDIVNIAESLAIDISKKLKEKGLIRERDLYLERFVDEILQV